MVSRIKTHEQVKKELEEFKELVKEDPETAKILARIALIRTGVMNVDGSMKKRIVKYPHSLTYQPVNMPKRRVRKLK